ncbi:MAG TPA: LCCL domain-containing protein [Steroidobacteraceae bacterium]|nr:LCCL domain-containing protein [Steroidobacteraceae bacterium]
MGALSRDWPRSLGLPGLLMPLAWAPAPALASTPLAPAPAVHEADWRTSPLDLNLRGLNGERFRFHCPRGKPLPGQVVGSGPYTDASAICPAAVHAGVIRAASGGLVTIELRPGQTHYVGSLRHYVQSEDYEPFWSGSFLVVAPDTAAQPPGSARRAPLTRA